MESRSSSGDWERIQALFVEALERPAHERGAFLEDACAGDARLRTEVESLLDAHERAGAFLDDPVLGAGPAPPRSIPWKAS